MANPLVTVGQIKAKSLINGNVDAAKLSVIINRVQDIYISEVLGKQFYNSLIASTTYTTAEQTLINDYLFYYLMLRTEIESCVHFNWDMRNKSVGSSSDQYAAAGDWDSIEKLKNELSKQAHVYKNNLIEFLIANKTDFPLYVDCRKTQESNSSFSQNIAFAVARRR